MAEETKTTLNVPVIWDGVEDVTLDLANQVLGQVGHQGEVILTFGQLTPPILQGTPEQQAEQASEIPFVSVKPVARVALTKAGLDDLIRVLQATQKNYERAETHLKQRQQQTDKDEEQ